MKKSSFFLFTIAWFIHSLLLGQDANLISRVDPPNWFSGMKNQKVELLVYSSSPSSLQFQLSKTSRSSASLLYTERSALNNYYYIGLCIKKQPASGFIEFHITDEKTKKISHWKYPVSPKNYSPLGLSPEDAMYMVFPDRFSNGNEKNDSIPGYFQSVNRNELKGRRGGDIQGIISHLNYIADLGATAIWINPMVENNEPIDSYHGYATTDSYSIDPRIGSPQDLKDLTSAIHKLKMKHVWDIVYNHWGDQHKLFKVLPDSNWIHRHSNFTKTNYRAETIMDPHASNFDKNTMSNGWFDNHMPDLNQQDPHLALYLIQNSIWWIESAQIDAFRIDTYSYPDQLFMSKLNQAIKLEYPKLFCFGETWVQGSPIQAWYTQSNRLNTSFNSYLDAVTDFQLFYAITKGLNENFGWEEGLRRIELTLAHDYLYDNPENLVTFLDNHDLPRIYSVLNENLNKWKMAHALLLTTRGIPCIYYGTEILMTGFCNPDAHVREEFPGGWKDHNLNLFNQINLNSSQQIAYNFLQKLMNYRKENTWMSNGELKQFVPQDNTYAYARIDKQGKKALLCLFNLNTENYKYSCSKLQEILLNKKSGFEILNKTEIKWDNAIEIPGNSFQLIEISY